MCEQADCCYRRLWQHHVNNLWAIASTTPWYRIEVRPSHLHDLRSMPMPGCITYPVCGKLSVSPEGHACCARYGTRFLADSARAPQIEGRENLPPKDQPAVYVANHQSFLVLPSRLLHARSW